MRESKRIAAGGAFELVAFGELAADFEPRWPRDPGAVLRDDQGEPLLLHIAARRWFLARDDEALAPAVAAFARAGAVIDVRGKWHALRESEGTRAPWLRASLDLESALDGRDCAAVTILDAPAWVARAREGLAIWVPPSFLGHLRELRAGLGGRPGIRA
jgi:hypothetical protein